MKAWILRSPAPIRDDPLELSELPTPEPGPNQVRLRVDVCGICRTDLHIAEGDLPAGKDSLILGHEIVGVVDAVGEGATRVKEGESAGVTWLGETCGRCKHCLESRENYCADFKATGRDTDGGFAEYVIAQEDAVFSLKDIPLPKEELAPLLCAGVAGYCAYRLLSVGEGDSIGLYGFGPTADYVLRVARHLGNEVYVSSRSERNLRRARQVGAAWAGNAAEQAIPTELDAAIVFPPAGPLVELALRSVRIGGVVVLAPVAMSPIEIQDYSTDFWGRDLRTLYNVNRREAHEFLGLASEVELGLGVDVFPFADVQEAMIRVREGQIRNSNAVVRVTPEGSQAPGREGS
ncbi:MAG: alcohol dehydrogenase catalytic domain-containing protein [Gemmatimonadota bacterium]|jgi:propanol-preferring alcohol dehydrogenase